jgi:nitroreductase
MIATAVAAGATAPSGANQQPWTFVAVSDPAVKTRIRLAAEEEERRNYEGRFPEGWLHDLAPLGTGAEKPYLEIAPWLVVVFRATTGPNGEKHYYTQESVGLACGMFFAACHAMGLATLCHTPNPMRFLNQILERPSQEKPYMLVPVGYPAADCVVPELTKKSLDEILVVVGDR